MCVCVCGGGGGGGVEGGGKGPGPMTRKQPEQSLGFVFLVLNLFYSLQRGSNGFITGKTKQASTMHGYFVSATPLTVIGLLLIHYLIILPFVYSLSLVLALLCITLCPF